MNKRMQETSRQVAMNYQPVNLQYKLNKFSEHWSPKIIAQMNDYHFKLAKVLGAFVWHDHPETDEVFLVLKGQLEIYFRDGKVTLNEGEMYVIPSVEQTCRRTGMSYPVDRTAGLLMRVTSS
jgi:mannose-6-phosphate isomerase-like protein (cupin superfamily)